MRLYVFTTTLFFLVTSFAFGQGANELLDSQNYKFDPALLRADKEIESKYFSNRKGIRTTAKLIESSSLENTTHYLMLALTTAISNVDKFPRTCDLMLINRYRRELLRHNFPTTVEFIKESIIYLRHNKLIDDLLYDIISRNLSLEQDLKKRIEAKKKPFKVIIPNKETSQSTNKIYKKIGDKWPNDVTACSTQAIWKLLELTKTEFNLKKLNAVVRKVRKTSTLAYKRGLISLENQIRIDTFLDHKVPKLPFLLNKYLDNLKFSKNLLKSSLTGIRGKESNNEIDSSMDKKTKKFHTKFVKRRNKLTKRKDLYKKYNATQIMLLADILVKASKRINANRSQIEIYYDDKSTPDETYVISPMEQYRMSLKMLQKDMNNLRVLKTFKYKFPTYDDVIVAAFETGVYSNKELSMIITYEDFWNPKVPTWKKVVGFTFSMAGTVSFYLPPPWNIVGAIGLVFAQTKLTKSTSKANSKSNTNSIF